MATYVRVRVGDLRSYLKFREIEDNLSLYHLRDYNSDSINKILDNPEEFLDIIGNKLEKFETENPGADKFYDILQQLEVEMLFRKDLLPETRTEIEGNPNFLTMLSQLFPYCRNSSLDSFLNDYQQHVNTIKVSIRHNNVEEIRRIVAKNPRYFTLDNLEYSLACGHDEITDLILPIFARQLNAELLEILFIYGRVDLIDRVYRYKTDEFERILEHKTRIDYGGVDVVKYLFANVFSLDNKEMVKRVIINSAYYAHFDSFVYLTSHYDITTIDNYQLYSAICHGGCWEIFELAESIYPCGNDVNLPVGIAIIYESYDLAIKLIETGKISGELVLTNLMRESSFDKKVVVKVITKITDMGIRLSWPKLKEITNLKSVTFLQEYVATVANRGGHGDINVDYLNDLSKRVFQIQGITPETDSDSSDDEIFKVNSEDEVFYEDYAEDPAEESFEESSGELSEESVDFLLDIQTQFVR